MKNISFILILVAATSFFGCSKASPSTHLTQAQVLDIAKPRLPLRAGESYYAHFTNGIWTVCTTNSGRVAYTSSTELEIRDSDGIVVGTKTDL